MSPYLRDLRAKVGTALVVLPSVAGVVFDEQGRVLLIKHANGYWTPPGGGIEPDEVPTDTLVREVWEETGLLVEPLSLIGVFGGPECRVHYANGDTVSYVVTAFECRVKGGAARPDGRESLDVGFFAEEELQPADLSTLAHVVLRAAFARAGDGGFQPPSWLPNNEARS